ncbi:DNA translocase FtsK 4TM domain-containing protein [Sphingomonas lutea]|uniref:DNA translocase FtsK 4TM domain-containing protein n=1 Tax=Sphingomonas lutea TaxID=1045317 RepID=UPI003CC836AB
MATVAARAPKRELGPDWRDALRDSLRRFAVRALGALLFAIGAAAAVALATHSQTDPSLTTAAGGTPANWLGLPGAYVSDALLLLFGLGSALFVPVLLLAGLRLMRLAPRGGSVVRCRSPRSGRC